MINKLEKKFGRFAINNLIIYILGGYAIGYILMLLQSRIDIFQYITLEPQLVMKGQVWRLFTWVLTPPQSLSFWVIFMFMLYYFIGKTLEQNLGAFRYNLYMFSGWFFMTLGAMVFYWVSKAVSGGIGISMNVSTYYINMASFLAFAVLFPDARVYFFGILPIKIKILAWIDAGFLSLQVVSSIILLIACGMHNPEVDQMIAGFGYTPAYLLIYCSTEVFSILVSMLNFLIFFLMNRKAKFNAYKRREQYRKAAERGRMEGAAFASGQTQRQTAEPKKTYRPDYSKEMIHVCSICGRTSTTNPELQFRFCSKCSGSREYCQDHLFTHEHVK